MICEFSIIYRLRDRVPRKSDAAVSTSKLTEYSCSRCTCSGEDYNRIACGGGDRDPSEDDLVEANVNWHVPHNKYQASNCYEVWHVDPQDGNAACHVLCIVLAGALPELK